MNNSSNIFYFSIYTNRYINRRASMLWFHVDADLCISHIQAKLAPLYT